MTGGPGSEKETFYSCYITGMKAYFKAMKKTLTPKMLLRIERELEQSDTKRSDIKRVLLRFDREQQLGYRLE